MTTVGGAQGYKTDNPAFAQLANQCDNTSMQKPLILAVNVLAVGLILLGSCPCATNSRGGQSTDSGRKSAESSGSEDASNTAAKTATSGHGEDRGSSRL